MSEWIDRAMDKGWNKGWNEGITAGEQRTRRSIMENLIAEGIDPQKAASLTGLTAGA